MQSLVKRTELSPRINELDFRRFQEKLHGNNPERGWDGEMFDVAVNEYKRFLELKLKYPKKTFSPTKLMDEIWHLHILDTRTYSAECDGIFGKFLHHNPSFGSWDSDFQSDRLNLSQQNLREYYSKLFGESPRDLNGNCHGGCDHDQGGDCSGCDDDDG